MHELSVTENILEIAVRHAGNANARRITDLYLVIGCLSTMVDESVQFYWDIISKDTLAEGARLHFKRISARMKCNDCNREYSLRADELACPKCDGVNVKILTGQEFYLEAIEVEPV